jgi:toxin-antitoxin system PIN domain toxin
LTILDANVLLYAYDSSSPQHAAAAAWVEALFASPETIGLPWQTIWAFLRVRTNLRLVSAPKPPADTFAIVREWLELPGVVLLQPGPRHADILEKLVVEQGAIGPLVSDATLAALAIEHGSILASTDRDFQRFEQVRWVNPLG